MGHGNGLAARAAGEELQGLATLAVGYNPDTGGIFDLGAAHQARMGLADVGLSTVVTVATQRLRTPEGSVPWLERRRDVTATAWGEAIGYDHQAQKQYGNGFHEWKDDPIAMSTKVAWTAVPTLLTAGWGGAAKGGLSATGKAAKGVPDGAPKKVPHSWRTGVNAAPLARLEADIEARGKAYPSGHGPGKATNSLLDAVDDVPPPRKSPDAPVSNSINTARGADSIPDVDRSSGASASHGPGDASSTGRPDAAAASDSTRADSGATRSPDDAGRPRTGTGTEVSRPGTYDTKAPVRETVPAKDAGVRYAPDDVQKALDDAPQDKWGDPVDHRNGKPLLLENINGDRGWEMRWDPDGKGWVAENRGQGGDHGLPAKGEPGSYGYDAKGRRLPFANHRPEYAPGQVQEVWDRSRTSLINRIRGGELELPEPTQSNQTWVRVRDNADGPELVDLGESKGKWKLIEWDPNAPRQDVWDMGHISEAKYSTLREEYLSGQITEERFLRQYHEARNYEVQDPGRNRSHDDE